MENALRQSIKLTIPRSSIRIVGDKMAFVIFMVGVLVGILIAGSVFVYLTIKKDNNPSIKAMHDYIHQLEEENEELKQRNAKLKEYAVHNGY